MNAADFDITTPQQPKTKQQRKRQKLFIPRPHDCPSKELDHLHFDLLEDAALNGVTHIKQSLMRNGSGKEDIRTAERDDYFAASSRTGFIVEVHRMADDWKLHRKVLTYTHFEAQGGASYLGVKDLKVLIICIICDSTERVQRLMRLILACMAWCVSQDEYLKDYKALAQPVWVDRAGQYHSLFD
jgi:hypothetical protein